MDKRVKILHGADFHMGSEFSNLESVMAQQRKRELLDNFRRMGELCKQENVEILLLAGDLFENWHTAAEDITYVQHILAELENTQVFIAAGNHDPLSPHSPYDKPEEWPSHVAICPHEGASVVLEDLKTEVWGASFSSSRQSYSLMNEWQPKEPSYIQLGVLHGEVGGGGREGQYNPIPLSSIARSGLDYLALGHIHKTTGLQKEENVYYAYSGNPEGRGFDELGERGVWLGEVGKQVKPRLEFVPLCSRMYLHERVDISGLGSSHAIATHVTQVLQERYGAEFERHLYRIVLEGDMEPDVRVSVAHIQPLLSELYYIELDDRTAPLLNIEDVSHEFSLRGQFVSEYLARAEKRGAESSTLERALKYGWQALQGEIKSYED